MKKNKIALIFLLIITILFITKDVYADDYLDDIYDGDYSIKDMLNNYNVITFGKKELDSHMLDSYMIQNNFSKGNARIFHINSNFLVNGKLSFARIDFNSSNSNVSSFSRNYESGYGIMCGYAKQQYPYPLLSGCNRRQSNMVYTDIQNNYAYVTIGNYINFDKLYEKITTEQSKIRKGRYIISKDGFAHVETGGEYYIDDINEINSIVFDNFEDNQNNLTIITINNSSNINFPKIYASENNNEKSLVPTNDFIGMERPNSNYADYYVIDKYHGNIIWNIPNATYIELPSAPFIGHLIAPKADVKGPELHYAGAFIVNSLYLEGNSEAHFYPLTITNIPYRSSMDNYKAIPKINKNHGNIEFNNGINNELLEEGIVVLFRVETKKDYLLSGLEIKDENGNNVEFREIGNGEYEFIMPATNVTITPQFKDNNIINQITTNPKTGSNIMLVLGIIFINLVFGFIIIKKEKNKIM